MPMTTQELKQYIDKVLGNSIRCLLPSYWWKRLFNQVADRIDEVEQSTSKLIESKVEEVKMPIVESVDELEKLELAKGRVAAVEKTGESATVKMSDCYFSTNYEEDWGKYTIVKGVEEKDNAIIDEAVAVVFSASKEMITKDAFQVNKLNNGIFYYTKWADGKPYVTTLEEVNKALSSGKYRAVIRLDAPDDCFIDDYFTFYSEKPQPSLYIKGDSWERLAKESDLGGNEGGNGEDKTLTFYAPIDDVSLSDAEKQHNAESYQKVAEGFESDTYYDIKVLLSTTQLVALDVIKTINPAIDNGRLKLTFGGVGSGIDLQMLTVTSDGSATITIEGIEESGVELRDLYIYENYDGTLTELTEEQKAWNVETLELAKQGKAIVRITLHGNTFILELVFNEDNEYQFGYTQFSPSGGVAILVYVAEDGLSGVKIEESHFDSELSTTSINAVQNKVITAALNTKADKSDIKTINGVSLLGGGNIVVDVDTSDLATKEDLNAYATSESLQSLGLRVQDDMDTDKRELTEAINTKQDKLVSGTNIKTINGTSILGSGDITISGGGSSSGSGAYAEVNHGTSDTTFALTPNTFHVWDEVSALTLTLGSETVGVANEFLFQFTSGATATSLTLPDDIKWANDAPPTIAENMIYQVSILKGLASVLEFGNKAASSVFPATLEVGSNGELGVSVYDTLIEGVVLQDGDLTLIVDGENYSITEYEIDYAFSNQGLLLLSLEDGPMILYYILVSSGEVKCHMM